MRAQDDAALDLVAEAGLTGGGHDALGSHGALGGLDADAVAHAVEAGQVRGDLGGHDQVVGAQRVLQVRARDLDDLSTGLAQLLDGGVEGVDDVLLVALAAQLLDDADLQALHGTFRGDGLDGLGERGNRLVQGGRIVGVVAADQLGQGGRVGDRAGDGADLVQGRGHGHQAVTRHRAVGGLGADRAGHERGLADRAARIGTEGQGHHVGRDSGGGAAAGAAGDTLSVPRVLGRAEGGVLGGGAHGELIHVGLADDGQAGFLDLGGDGRVVGRLPVAQDLRGAGGAQSPRHHVVLDGDRHARQAMQGFPRRAARVHVGGGRQGALAVDGDECVDAVVDRVDAVQARLSQLDGGDLAGGQHVRQLEGALLQQLVHQSSPRICGTRNMPSWAAGA